ncbi:MAG: hypothetical protein HZB51_33880 [Chloroflexi bacterium]|nr:hypothetical protein [Chloroflexota bacterium]
MHAKNVLVVIGLVGLVLLLGKVSPALACDPDRGDFVGCANLTPPAAAISTVIPTGVPTAVPTLIASGRSNLDNAASLTNIPTNPDGSFPLACLLPDGNNASNALGVSQLCPALPLLIRTVKAPPPPTPAPKVVVAPTAVQPKGDSPASAKTVTDAFQVIEPGGVHWYKIDNGRNFYLDVYIDANGASGITLALYSPEQTNALAVDLPPKGRGGPVKNQPHDLLWKGSYATGVWHALVRNYNSAPVQYKIGIAQTASDRNCVTYWERVSGTMTLWTDCGLYQDVDNFGK